MNSTDSEFKGFLKDEFTTLAETDDRILATSLVATLASYVAPIVDWNTSYDAVLATLLQHLRRHLLARAPGDALRDGHGGPRGAARASPTSRSRRPTSTTSWSTSPASTCEGLTNDGEVFIAADRPYGLIEATVVRDRRDDPRGAARLPGGAAVGRRRAGRPAVRRPRGAARRRRRRGPVAHRRGARPGAVRPPADRRARRRAVPAGAVRRRPERRRHRGAAGGRQRGVRGAVRPGLPDPGRRARRRRDPGRARPAAAERRRDRARRDRRQPAPDRAAAAGGDAL